MKNFIFFIVFVALSRSFAFGQCPTLVWSDEFDGTELDLSKWEPMIGDGCDYGICGWGNNELQYYKAENAVVSNGTLKIIAKEERVRGKNYTSARLRSKGLADFTFGRFEARIKLLEGQGLWPAFWMLSTNEPYGGWPQSGEIDIMELLGQDPEIIYGSIHYGQPWPDNAHQGEAFKLYDSSIFADDFHVFAVEWEPGVIRWYVDDILYSIKTDTDVSPENWPFDAGNQMHFLLNVAVGGNWPGNPDATTPFPSQMEVDYVRVYDGGFNPSISGNRLVPYMAAGELYSISNAPNGSTFNWSVPNGANIISGQGSDAIVVDWGSTSGNVVCNVTTSCISKQYVIGVTVEPNYIYDFTFENFDDAANISMSTATGTLTEVSNPDPSGVNTSSLSAQYIRNEQEQYDVIAYSTSIISDASLYKSRQKKLYMDVHTNAPVGTEIIVQLESPDATSSNYPTGRHSRYVGKITQNGNWERIVFNYIDSPDGSTADTDISNIIILFASNSFTNDTFYWDNFDSYKADDGSGGTNIAPNSTFTYSTNDLTVDFDGTGSTDSDGNVVSWDWDFGDGNIGTGSTISHTYSASGDYNVSLTVTDNEGASDVSSQSITVTEGSTGTPISMHVQSIITGTQDAGKGAKNGTATVTIHNDLEGVVSGATVTGTFSGTFTETVSGVTGVDGTVVLITNATAKGGVTVDFCVEDVTHSTLIYDNLLNDITCTAQPEGTTSSTSINKREIIEKPTPIFYPNPVNDVLMISGEYDKIEIIDMSGKKKGELRNSENKINISYLSSGTYLIRIYKNGKTYSKILIKQ